VIERADDGDLVHPAAHARQVFADVNARRAGRGPAKLAAHLGGGVGLHIDHVLRGGAAEQIEQDDILGPPRPALAWAFFRS
jgi:hypothetical protein